MWNCPNFRSRAFVIGKMPAGSRKKRRPDLLSTDNAKRNRQHSDLDIFAPFWSEEERALAHPGRKLVTFCCTYRILLTDLFSSFKKNLSQNWPFAEGVGRESEDRPPPSRLPDRPALWPSGCGRGPRIEWGAASDFRVVQGRLLFKGPS